jgi:hypothetical protein
MPDWLEVILGVIAGSAVVAGALYLAIRPEFRPKPAKSWLPKADQAHRQNEHI